MEDTLSVAMDVENLSVLGALIIEWGMRVLGAVLIMIAGWVIGNWISKRVQKLGKFDPTLCSFLGGFSKYTVLAVAIVAVLGQFGVQTASLLAVLGAAGLAIGLALQGTLGNVAAGTMLLILRPFQVGDYITAGGIGGTVKSLGLFGSELSTPDNVYIYLPNSKIWNNDIWNYSRNPLRRQDIKFGISYGDNIGQALTIIQKVLEKEPRILNEPEDKQPQVLTDMMGDSSVNLIARFWCSKDDYWGLRWDLTKAIKEELDKQGITIPFPTRTLNIVNPDAEEKEAKSATVKSKSKKVAETA